MLGFLKVVSEPVVVPKKLSDALLEGSRKHPQAIGSFRSNEKMCALMLAYTMAYGCPRWMGNNESGKPAKEWKDFSRKEKAGIIILGLPVFIAAAGVVGFFFTRLKMHYKVPYSVLFDVMHKNDTGSSFYSIADDLQAKGH